MRIALAAMREMVVRLRDDWRTARNRIALRSAGVSLARAVEIQIDSTSRFAFGLRSRIGYGSVVSVLAADMSDPGVASASELVLGARTTLNEYCNVRCAGARIVIGSDCIVGQFVSLIGSNHAIGAGVDVSSSGADTARLGITIGDGVWIGCSVTVLPGVTIGDGAVVGANAVVTKDVPAGAIAVGNPARVFRSRADR